MKKIVFYSLVLFVATSLLFTSCKKDDEDTSKNIVELAQGNSDLSSLVAAVQRAGLVDALSDESKQYTVFAPTNAAFAKFLSDNGFANLEAVPVDALRNLLLNHVLGTEVKAADVTTGYVSTLATYDSTNSNIDMYISAASDVVINGGPKVVTKDVDANNGVIHVIDALINIPLIPTFAIANPDFSILVQALTRSDLVVNYADVLSDTGPFTIFAPNNAAFLAVLSELNFNSLNDIPANTLETILVYHFVVGSNVLAGSLTDGQAVTTAQGASFNISLANGAKIEDGLGRTTNIIVTDIQGGNGVVHVIDRVLLFQ